MHAFSCIVKSGKITPTSLSKQQLLEKLLDHYERAGTTFTIKIEEVLPNINNGQEKLYKAFVLKAAEHFGTSFSEMQTLLSKFFPHDEFGANWNISRWDTKQLNDFIDKASAHLAEFGFHF